MSRREITHLGLQRAGKSRHFEPRTPGFEALEIRMLLSVPATPSLQSATAMSSTNVDLVWGNVSGEDGYKLCYKRDGDSGAAAWHVGATVGRDVTRGTISGLTAGTRYVFDVQAYNGAGGSPFSNQITITMPTATLPLTSPEPLTLTVKSSTRIDLSWTNSQNEDGYKVWQWKNTGNAWNWVQIATVNRDVTSYSVNNLSPNSTYYFKVQAFNGKGIAETNWKSATTTAPVASGPVNNNFAGRTSISGTSATVTGTNVNATKESGEPNHAGNSGGKSVWWKWTAPSSGSVQIDTIGSNFDTTLGVYDLLPFLSGISSLTTVASNDDGGGNRTSKVTFTAVSGRTYQIAVDGYGGASGNITLHVNLTAAVAPQLPTNVAATDGTYGDKVRVTWTASANATAYEVWRNSSNNSGTATKISTSNVAGTSYDDTTATAGTTYWYWVNAKNANGTSGFSAGNSGYRASGVLRFDHAKFLAQYTARYGTLNTSQRAGLDQLLTFIEQDNQITDIRWAAYMLATVKHECANTWQPIEEYGKGAGHSYGVPDPITGKTYYGRGYSQLTWKNNYQRLGNAIGVDLVNHPELALNPSIAYRIMSYGMRVGSFTGVKLADYLFGNTTDYINARRIINGTDQAAPVASYATSLESMLRGSMSGGTNIA
jgi:predicted chitinase/fibronectin type 3 domain-containing protein